MATSSSGRQSISQWQRLLALVKEYVHLQQKSSSCGSEVILRPHPLAKSAALSEQESAAALQALSRCVHRMRAVKATKSITEDATAQEMQLKSSTKRICVNNAMVKEFLADGCIPASEHSTIDARSKTVDRAQQSASVSSETFRGPQHINHGTPTISSATMSRDSNTDTQIPNSPFIRITRPINCSSSLNPVRLSVPPPTYSSMKFPRTLSSNSNSDEKCGKESVGDSHENESPSVAGDVSSSLTTSAVVPALPETELQRALKTVNSYIPLSLSQINLGFLRSSKEENTPPRPKWMDRKKDVSKVSVDSRTRHLVQGLTVESEGATLRRLCDLCHHLRTYPSAYTAAVKCGGIGRVLRVLAATRDKHVALEARTALGLMGYAGSVSGRGLRVLTIDGGGTRGLVAIELLRRLEEESGKAIHQMFDMICGVSTGAILAVLVGIHRKSLAECERLYRELSEKIFTQTTLKGATGLVINNSYYDSKAWDAILRENMGEEPLLENVAVSHPKVCLVASHAVRSVTQAYLFRNYVLPHRVASHYSGTSRALLWQAVRASAAAPGYFSEFQLEDKVLMDGGILVNNPAAIAVHEARQLWPDASFQCVVSLGTGRFQPVEPGAALVMNWGNKLRSVINSATDTEGVHTILHDLLPGSVYFRFNPHLSDEFPLDEIKPERLDIISRDTELYARKNAAKFQEAAAALSVEKTLFHRVKDYVRKAQYLYGFDSK